MAIPALQCIAESTPLVFALRSNLKFSICCCDCDCFSCDKIGLVLLIVWHCTLSKEHRHSSLLLNMSLPRRSIESLENHFSISCVHTITLLILFKSSCFFLHLFTLFFSEKQSQLKTFPQSRWVYSKWWVKPASCCCLRHGTIRDWR